MEIPFAGGNRLFGRAMIGVSVAELVAVELLVPWRTARLVLLVLGAVSLVWVVWFVRRSERRHHLVTDTHLLLRGRVSGELRLPLATVVRAATGQKTEERDGAGRDGDTVWFAESTTTGVVLTLASGTVPEVSGIKALDGLGEVRVVRFWADDARAAVTAIEAAREGPGDDRAMKGR